MGELILGVILQYMISASFRLFLMVDTGLNPLMPMLNPTAISLGESHTTLSWVVLVSLTPRKEKLRDERD